MTVRHNWCQFVFLTRAQLVSVHLLDPCYLSRWGRIPRAIDGGLVDHATNRGNIRAAVFADDEDDLGFLQAIAANKMVLQADSA